VVDPEPLAAASADYAPISLPKLLYSSRWLAHAPPGFDMLRIDSILNHDEIAAFHFEPKW
jgi:hypothetical protein